MYQTIQVSSCVSVQGDLVEHLPNGEAIVRDGGNVYRGRPIAPIAAPLSSMPRRAGCGRSARGRRGLSRRQSPAGELALEDRRPSSRRAPASALRQGM